MRIVIALTVVLMALLPMGPAAAVQHAAHVSAFSEAPQSPCDSASAACAEVCQPVSALAIKHLQAAASPPAFEVQPRDVLLPHPAQFVVSSASLARVGPPAYLRY